MSDQLEERVDGSLVVESAGHRNSDTSFPSFSSLSDSGNSLGEWATDPSALVQPTNDTLSPSDPSFLFSTLDYELKTLFSGEKPRKSRSSTGADKPRADTYPYWRKNTSNHFVQHQRTTQPRERCKPPPTILPDPIEMYCYGRTANRRQSSLRAWYEKRHKKENRSTEQSAVRANAAKPAPSSTPAKYKEGRRIDSIASDEDSEDETVCILFA